MVKSALKTLFRGASLAAVFPSAVASGFGRWSAAYESFAHIYALAPGIPGDYLRLAYYRLTLEACAPSSRVSFGSFFPHVESRIGPDVYIGSYCVIDKAVIGERTQIADAVQILSGSRQPGQGAGQEGLSPVSIGADCWIGASAIMMADVGAGSTVGAGSVVTHPIPAASVAVGSPARVIRSAANGG